ncbi:MAG: peptide chain release factor N(5)-glutamine methyltransferase [Nocardioides sp.]|nr:peptide chain release factor N(5)-glutamine methyltransferase [Nocardioides sp.]
MPTRREVLAAATARLSSAGVESPEYDAHTLLAHVLGVERSRLPLTDDVPISAAEQYDVLVARRAAREPLQHLTGIAHFRHVELEVGPGVFVPRPETELLAGWAVEQARALVSHRDGSSVVSSGQATSSTDARGSTGAPTVVDLGTGSGAIAKAVADEVPAARVFAVELDDGAHAWAARNLAGTGVELRQGDLADAFDDLAGTVDIVVSNPPYIPHEAWESVAVEVRDHDPQLALYANGDDGLDTVRVVERRAALLLRPGGVVGVEHGDAQGETAPAVFSGSGRWELVRDHPDMTGRPRFLTARLAR